MGDGLRTIRVVTTDEALLASARGAIQELEGWELDAIDSVENLLSRPPVPGDVILLDVRLTIGEGAAGDNVYEVCRTLTGRVKCRTFVVSSHGNQLSEPIAHFCGATGVFQRPLTRSALEKGLGANSGPRPALPSESREADEDEHAFVLPEALLTDLVTGESDRGLIAAVCDSATGLFNYAFLNYKLDEEFKRARRFEQPLSCVMLGFEGQASDEILRELAGIFLAASRDTDVLGRFDESSFLFLLPNTGPDGARAMAERVGATAEERGLKDLVGDSLALSVGISSCPHPEIRRREDLYQRARQAFFSARAEGGGVVLGV
tara:strand:- start:9404 stop:10363 length:960 start_codon:yes stop_codon:yes gene_type:complete